MPQPLSPGEKDCGIRVSERRLHEVAKAAIEAAVFHLGRTEWEQVSLEDQEVVIDEVADDIQELLGLAIESETEET